MVTDPLVEPDAFRIMQKFIYQNYKNAPLSVYSIMDVLYLGMQLLGTETHWTTTVPYDY